MSTGRKPAALDWSDAAAVQRWGAALRENIDDIAAAGEDQTRPPGARDLGRRAARHTILDGKRSLVRDLAFAGFPSKLAHQAPASGQHESESPAPASGESTGEIEALADAALDIARAHTDDEEGNALESMPLAGVLFLAMIGSPGERAEIDPPLVLALRAIRVTVRAWAHASSRSTIFAGVSFGALDLLSRRIDATIEIARRGRAEGEP